MRKGQFSIDGENRNYVIGYTDDTSWNGWANVWLEKDNLLAWLRGCDPNGQSLILCHGNGDVSVTTTEAGIETFVPEVINMVTLYSMNGYCFFEANEIAGSVQLATLTTHEWYCPTCKTLNRELTIKDAVECIHCETTYEVKG